MRFGKILEALSTEGDPYFWKQQSGLVWESAQEFSVGICLAKSVRIFRKVPKVVVF